MMRGALFGIVAAMTMFITVAISRGETAVTVKLVDGKTYRGVVDSLSNDEKLWLRNRIGKVHLQRPIEWQRIEAVEVDSVEMTVAALRSQLPDLATPMPTTPRTPRLPPKNEPNDKPIPQIVALELDAFVANWNSDAASDGLVVTSYGIDANGNQIPLHGSLTAELFVLDRVPGDQASTSGGIRKISLGSWSRSVDGDSVFKFEFQRRDPQLDHSISRYGLLTVRVAVPGQGVFDRTLDGIRTRSFTPVADQLLMR